jgi:hypothetical protein
VPTAKSRWIPTGGGTRKPFARARQLGPPHPFVAGIGPQLDQPLRRQRLREAAQVTRVEPQPCTQLAQVCAALADLEQHPRLAERPIAAKEVVVERSRALGDEAVEAADLGDLFGRV